MTKYNTSIPRCPGRLNFTCTCDGNCSGSRIVGACGCPVCSPLTMVPPAPPGVASSLTGVPPAPRNSGAGMTGFAEIRQQDVSGEFEFAAGSVTGLRQWTLAAPDFSRSPHDAGQDWPPALLTGATGFAWPPGVVEATCNNGYPHPVPAEFVDNSVPTSARSRCGCGHWAYWDLVPAFSSQFSSSGGLPVLGVIEGYGRVLLGERGFRSQKARIIALAPSFSIQAAVTAKRAMTEQGEYDEIAYRAQQQADAWMAVIQDQLGLLYPGARVFATATGLLASVKTRGRPQ